MFDWNDLRYFLAVAREGSTLAAGRSLRVSQTTVARRIAALERALGFPIFEKRQAGYVLTPAGEELLERAQQVETSANHFAEVRSRYMRNSDEEKSSAPAAAGSVSVSNSHSSRVQDVSVHQPPLLRQGPAAAVTR